MNVAENLYDYLKSNDKAELVGFGTFYVKNSSAKINDLTGSIEPPKRELSFSREQSGNRDFVSFMASHEFISEQTAYTWIKQYADSLNEKIQAGRQVTLGKLGKFEKGLLEEYSFTASDDLNLLGSSFSLGSLKNVQIFDQEDQVIDVLRTNESSREAKAETTLPKEFEREQAEIERQIEEARQLKDEEKIQETIQQTEQRIIQHSEAKVESTIEKPQNLTQEEFDPDIDNATREDKTQQTIDRAAEFKEEVIVEDIKKAEQEDREDNDDNAAISSQDNELLQKAEEIVRQHSKKNEDNKIEKSNDRKKKGWKILLWIIIVLLFLCLALIVCHWFGLLKDVEFMKPVTDRLSYYIPVRETKPVEAEQPLTATNTETVSEETDMNDDLDQQEEIVEEPKGIITKTNTANSQKNATNTNKNTAKTQSKKTDAQEPTTAPVNEPVVEDNTPVIVQDHSKLGFDVVSGSYADETKAREQAKKAKRLGYDGYVIKKIKGGTPIYYTSYGSRRTQSDATDLCSLIKSRLGGDFYIISR